MESETGLLAGQDGLQRCWWPGNDAEYLNYHDTEWGFPVTDNIRLFEKLCLEGFQAGLSWLTILRKRENFRAAFAGFDFYKVARFGSKDIKRLLANAGIIRHRGKIEAAIGNARLAVKLSGEAGSLAAYFWCYEEAAQTQPASVKELMNTNQTPTSVALSKDLKRRGWRFLGPVTCYAFMQAMGLVNGHVDGCCIHKQVVAARARLHRPG